MAKYSLKPLIPCRGFFQCLISVVPILAQAIFYHHRQLVTAFL
jgi:hypothetical protein